MVEKLKPLAADLRAIEKRNQGVSSQLGGFVFILGSGKTVRYSQGNVSMVLETGQALFRTPPACILQYFASDHENEILKGFIQEKKSANCHNYRRNLPKLPSVYQRSVAFVLNSV